MCLLFFLDHECIYTVPNTTVVPPIGEEVFIENAHGRRYHVKVMRHLWSYREHLSFFPKGSITQDNRVECHVELVIPKK